MTCVSRDEVFRVWETDSGPWNVSSDAHVSPACSLILRSSRTRSRHRAAKGDGGTR